MSQADALKQLKIKTNTAKRLHKEMSSYEQERDNEQARMGQMKALGADGSDLRQAELVLQESSMMIPQTRARLEAAADDLESFLMENETDCAGSEELEQAKEVLTSTKEALAR